MSSHLIDDDTLQRAVTAMAAVERINDPDVAGQLGRAMLQLNERAVAERYPDDPTEPDLERASAFRWLVFIPGTRADLCAVLKSLSCIIYQCAEGTVTDTALYQRMREAERRLQGLIIESLPEYQSAAWG